MVTLQNRVALSSTYEAHTNIERHYICTAERIEHVVLFYSRRDMDIHPRVVIEEYWGHA